MGRSFRVVLETPEGPHAIDCAENELVWDAAARANIELPSICHQGRCLTCAARLIRRDFDQTAASCYYAADRESGALSLCRPLPPSALIVASQQPSRIVLISRTPRSIARL